MMSGASPLRRATGGFAAVPPVRAALQPAPAASLPRPGATAGSHLTTCSRGRRTGREAGSRRRADPRVCPGRMRWTGFGTHTGGPGARLPERLDKVLLAAWSGRSWAPWPCCAAGSRVPGGSSRLATIAAVADSGHRLAAVEPGAGGERLVEPLDPERLADFVDELGLPSPEHRPRLQADPLAQSLGRTREQGGPVRVAVHQREPRERDEAEGHVAGAVGRQTEGEPLLQELG